METKDLNSIGLAYLEMVEKRNIEAKKNHANALHKNQKALDVHSDEDEDHNDDPTDGDGDIDAADLKKLRKDADKDDKKFDKKKKSSKKDDDQDKFKAYDGPDADGQQGAVVGEAAKYPHMMYDPKTGKEFKAETPADHEKYAKMGYTHDKPEEIDEAMTIVSRKPHPEGGHIVTLKDITGKKVVRHLHNGKVKTISKESVEIDEASKEGTITVEIDHDHKRDPDAKKHNISLKLHGSGPSRGAMASGKKKDLQKYLAIHYGGSEHAKDVHPEVHFEAKNITTDDNALVSFYQIHSTSPKPRLAGHMNMQVLGGQHQMSAADIKKISYQAAKAGVGKMVKVDNSMLSKHIADYKNENKPAPPKIAVALSQHHAKSLSESTDLQEGAARQAALAKGLMDYCKEIGKDHMDHKDFADHAKHVKAGNWDKARAHADDQDTEVREKIHTLAIDHLGQGAASELYGGDRVSLSKNKGDGKLHASYNESVNVDDVLALIDQGYTLDQAEAMVAEASCGTVNASRKVSKAGDNDRNMANDQRSIPAKGADTAPVRPGTKQNQRDFDKAARMAKSKDKVSLKPMPAALAKKMETEELHGNQHKLDHNKDGKIDAGDMKKVRKHGAVQKESVMDRVSNMVEDIRAKNEISELHKKTLGSYAKKAMDDVDTQSRFATEYEKRGMAAKNPGVMDKNFKKANRADDKLRNRKAGIKTAIDKMTKEGTAKINELDKKTLGSYINKAADDVEYRAFALGAQEPTELGSVRKGRNRIKGIAKATDRLTKEGAGDINNPMRGTTSRFQGSEQPEPMRVKTMSKKREKELRDAGKLSNSANNASHYAGESVQEASKPTGIHHSTPVTAAQANDEQAAGRWTDKAGRNTMTEKEFVDMHTIHPDVLPEFDGNVAAKQTAEAIKKAPKVSPTPNKNPPAGDKKIVKSTEAPAANAGVVGESYMDKYARYIRGEI